MTAINRTYECRCCHWIGPGHEIVTKLIYGETRYDPAEYEWYCPDCNKPDTLDPFDGTLCPGCERVAVEDENEVCFECHTAAMEARYDEQKGH